MDVAPNTCLNGDRVYSSEIGVDHPQDGQRQNSRNEWDCGCTGYGGIETIGLGPY